MPVTYDEKTTCDELVKVYASHIKGKTVITTGVSAGGMGSAFVTSIARAQPSLLILAGRTRDKLQETARAILQDNPNVAVRPVVVDLASMASVRQAAADINAWDDVPKIDVLVNSAGIMKVPYQLTPDGFELTLATNYLGHFLFTNLIMDKLMAAASPRVILLGSDAHRLSPLRWGDPQFDNGTLYNGWAAYGQSKTALMLMAISLAEKLGNKGLRVFAIHPGVVMGTNLTSHLDAAIDLPDLHQYDRSLGNLAGFAPPPTSTLVSQEQAVATYVYAAFEPNLQEINGEYLVQCRVADPGIDIVCPWATSRVEAERWWSCSEELVEQAFEFEVSG